MKASLKLREEERSPLLRAKLPISVLGLPLVSSVSAGEPQDFSFHLRTALSAGPSLKLTYRPNPSTTTNTAAANANPPHHPFSLTIKSGVGLWGSPDNSPLLISAHLSLPSLAGSSDPNHTLFSIQIKPQLGDFSFKKTTISSPPNPNPNPNPKENGGGVYHPLPVSNRERTGLEDLLYSGVAAAVRTTLPVTKRAAMKLRWGLNLPSTGSGWSRLPFLTVDKISIEAVEEQGVECRKEVKVGSDGELGAVKGMCFWMGREVEELQRENILIKESIEQLRWKVSDGSAGQSEVWRRNKDDGNKITEKEGRKKGIGMSKNAASTTTNLS